MNVTAVTLSFIAKREFSDESSETSVFLKINEEDHYDDILKKIRANIASAKSGAQKNDDDIISTFVRLPRFMLRAAVRLLEWYDFYFDKPGFLRGGQRPAELQCITLQIWEASASRRRFTIFTNGEPAVFSSR